MAKKSFWQRGEDYAKKVSSEIIDQIKAGVAPWQKPWKPGEQISAENFSTGKKDLCRAGYRSALTHRRRHSHCFG